MLRPGLRVILVGISLDPLTLPAFPIVLKEVSLLGAIGYRRSEFREAIDLLDSGAIPIEQLVTATVGFDQVEEFFQLLSSPGNGHLKVLIDPML